MCSFLVWKNACLNYREFDLEGDLVGVPHTWYLSAQSFIALLKLVWRQYDIVAMNEWKKKWVGLQRTWVSKRTVENAQRSPTRLIDRPTLVSHFRKRPPRSPQSTDAALCGQCLNGNSADTRDRPLQTSYYRAGLVEEMEPADQPY